MPVRILVNGYSGKMGQTALQAIEADGDLALAGQTRRGDDLAAAIAQAKPDTVLDLTVASAVYANARAIIESGASPVIGTSGLTAEQVDQLRRLCAAKGLGGIVVPNFSLSAVLMMQYARDAIRHLQQAEIIELHHDGKEDSPSGTALRTAEMMNAAEPANRSDKKAVVPGARGAEYKNIPIHSVRLPGLVAHQEVLLGDSGQTLSIKSDVVNREAFIPGIQLACKKAPEATELHHGLEHFL